MILSPINTNNVPQVVSEIPPAGERQQLPDREPGDPAHLHHQNCGEQTLGKLQMSRQQQSW